MWGKIGISTMPIAVGKVTYRIKAKSNPASIYVRLRDVRSIDLTAKTGRAIDPKFWKDNKIKRAAAFDDKLYFIINFYLNSPLVITSF